MSGLPIRPARLNDESLASWLVRIARIYEIDVLEMLSQWGVLPVIGYNTHCSKMQSLDNLLSSIEPRTLQHPLHLSDEDLIDLAYSKNDWILRAARHYPVCALCWRDDVLNGHTPYLRKEWMQAWRVFCSIHSEPLESQHSLTGSHFPNATQIARAVLERSRSINSRLLTFTILPERRILRPLQTIEQFCIQALDNNKLGLRQWKKCDGEKFLHMVSDILIAVINDFYNPGRLRNNIYVPCLPRRCIELLAWRQPYRSRTMINAGLLTICDIADPAVRRTAFLHAAHWLGICEISRPSVHLKNRGRILSSFEKRVLAIQSLKAPAQEWLIEQIADWPKQMKNLWRRAADARYKKIDLYAKWRRR